jgi:hypothetical protein
MKEQLHYVSSFEFTAAMKTELWIGNQIQRLATVNIDNTDIVTVRTPIAYSNCTVASVQIGNSVHWYSDSEDWNGIQ